MRPLRAVYQLARADFLERTRTFQYLATIGITLWLGSLCLPPKSAHYVIFSIDHYRGIYNSAWIGISYAVLMTVWLSLAGFYLVKSAVERDRQTRVGEIVASTSVGKFEYVLGKVLSNAALLGSIAVVLLADATVMQWVRGEDHSFDLLALVLPSIVFVLPLVFAISAVAVLFEVLPVLRGGIGNVIYFFLWIFALSSSGASSHFATKAPALDFFGMGTLSNAVWQTLQHVDPKRASHDVGLIMGDSHFATQTFLYTGMSLTPSMLLSRFALLVVAVAALALAALCFDRFASPSRTRERRESGFAANLRGTIERATTPLLDLCFSSSFGALILAELRLMLRGANFWWYAVAAGLWIWTLLAPAAGQSIALGIAWVWPILIFSQMGTRETINQTEQFVYPTLHPLRRQFAALACAGVLLALLLGSGAVLHDLATHDLHAILGVLAGAVFIPSLALACGAAGGTTRVFEVLYLMLWYVGPMNASPLDYTSAANASVFAGTAVAALVVAFTARRTRLALA